MMKNYLFCMVLTGMAVSFAGRPAAAATGYVAQAGQTPAAPYTNWTGAASNIQDAIDVAANTLVLVSNGTYNITNQISLTNVMVLRSVNGATNTIVRRSSGATRIFSISNNAVIDGFTIREGNIGAENGGGIYMTTGTVQNCVIAGNYASKGGGIFMTNGVISNCIFTGNSVVYDGGGIDMYECSGGLVVNCIFTNNTAGRWGGGVEFASTVIRGRDTIRNCLIARNSAVQGGGGIGCYNASPMIENCTIVSNSAGATYSGGGFYQTAGGTPTMTNTIVYFNNALLNKNISGVAGVGFSCSPELVAGTNGNLNADPEFVDFPGSDYRLWPGSPCMDAGANQDWMTNAVDLAGNPRLRNGIVDMGAYELSTNMPFLCNFRFATNLFEVVFTAYVSGPDTNITWFGWDFTNGGSYNPAGAGLWVVTNTYPDFGDYPVRLAVSNNSGNVTSHVKTIRLYPSSVIDVVYVSTNGLAQWPYHVWAKAASNIQDAIDVAANTLVLVSNGTYNIANQISLNNGTVLRGVNGATNTDRAPFLRHHADFQYQRLWRHTGHQRGD